MKARPRASASLTALGEWSSSSVVVALVAEEGGVLGIVAQLVLPDVVEEAGSSRERAAMSACRFCAGTAAPEWGATVREAGRAVARE